MEVLSDEYEEGKESSDKTLSLLLPTNKTRLSLFLPPDAITEEPMKTKTSDKEYVKQLNIEEDTWKQLYNEQKQQRMKLLNKLKLKDIEFIDYSLFNEEEIKYINAGPDITEFIQEVEDFESLIKYVSVQHEAERQKYNAKLENIEKACILYKTSTLNN